MQKYYRVSQGKGLSPADKVTHDNVPDRTGFGFSCILPPVTELM
jgi:hypothetical protein